MDYQYQPEAAHRCKRDVLLCRLKDGDDPTWKRVRPRPARNNFLGAFVLCKGEGTTTQRIWCFKRLEMTGVNAFHDTLLT